MLLLGFSCLGLVIGGSEKEAAASWAIFSREHAGKKRDGMKNTDYLFLTMDDLFKNNGERTNDVILPIEATSHARLRGKQVHRQKSGRIR